MHSPDSVQGIKTKHHLTVSTSNWCVGQKLHLHKIHQYEYQWHDSAGRETQCFVKYVFYRRRHCSWANTGSLLQSFLTPCRTTIHRIPFRWPRTPIQNSFVGHAIQRAFPESLRNQILYLLQFSCIAGRPGQRKMYDTLWCSTWERTVQFICHMRPVIVLLVSYDKWNKCDDRQMREQRRKEKPKSRQVQNETPCSNWPTRVCCHRYSNGTSEDDTRKWIFSCNNISVHHTNWRTQPLY